MKGLICEIPLSTLMTFKGADPLALAVRTDLKTLRTQPVESTYPPNNNACRASCFIAEAQKLYHWSSDTNRNKDAQSKLIY